MGSLTVGVGLAEGGTLLIRGGTSSVGIMAAILAKRLGATVVSTTRRPERADDLRAIGVDHVVVDDGALASVVRELAPEGVDGVSERTVDRHVSNILSKIDAPSRAAATAFACKTGLIPSLRVDE